MNIISLFYNTSPTIFRINNIRPQPLALGFDMSLLVKRKISLPAPTLQDSFMIVG